MKNLAPKIYRQRLVIEGTCGKAITKKDIIDYLSKLSTTIKMKALMKPIANYSRFGWAGWIHWESSGAHFYAWDKPFIFFSVDIYSCKKFLVRNTVNFTKRYFQTTAIEIKAI